MNGQMLILDTSQIQARKPNPQVSEMSRLTWGPVTIPQNAIPITIHGHAVPPRIRRVRVPLQRLGAARHRRRGAADRHRRRAAPARRLESAPGGRPARRAPRRSRRSGRELTRPGLRRALLQHPAGGRPGHRRLLVHRLRAPRVRHPRSAAPEGDRVLHRAADPQVREPDERKQLRDVQAGLRSRTARGLVHGRNERLLRPAPVAERVAGRGRCAAAAQHLAEAGDVSRRVRPARGTATRLGVARRGALGACPALRACAVVSSGLRLRRGGSWPRSPGAGAPRSGVSGRGWGCALRAATCTWRVPMRLAMRRGTSSAPDQLGVSCRLCAASSSGSGSPRVDRWRVVPPRAACCPGSEPAAPTARVRNAAKAYRFCCQKAISPPVGARDDRRQPAGSLTRVEQHGGPQLAGRVGRLRMSLTST